MTGSAAEALAVARNANRWRDRLPWIVAAVCAALWAGGLVAVGLLINGVANRADTVAKAAAYQQWTDCIEDLTDLQEAAFEERLSDFLAAAIVRDDYVEAIAIVDELDALELTPTDGQIRRECGEQPPKTVL